VRALKLSLIVLAVVVLVPIVLVAFVVWTDVGTRFAFERAQRWMPEGVTIGDIDGRLADRMIVRDIDVDQEGMHLRVAEASLEWSATRLLRRRVVIHELAVTGVDIELRPTELEPDDPFELPARFNLPVTVDIDRLIARDIVVRPAPDAEPVRIERVDVSASFDDSQLDVRRLIAEGPLVTLEADAHLTASGDYPVTARLDWTLRPPDVAEVPGSTRIDGSLRRLEIEQTLGAPYHLVLQATVHDLLDDATTPYVTAALQIDGLNPARVGNDLPPLILRVDARAEGPVDALAISGDAHVDPVDTAQGAPPSPLAATGPAAAAFAIQVTPGVIDVERVAITQPMHDGRLEARGHVRLGDDFGADLRANWSDLQWPLDGDATLRAPRGELRFVGVPEDYALTLAGVVEVPDQPPVAIELSGTGDLASATLSLSAEAAGGQFGGDADIRWDPSISARVALTGRDVDPGVFAPEWPGRIGFEIHANVDIDDDEIALVVDRASAEGRMRDLPVALAAEGRYRQRLDQQGLDAHALHIETLEARAATTRLTARGTIDGDADLSWTLDAPDLALLAEVLPHADGIVQARGSITGALPRPRIDATLAGDGIVADGFALESAELVAEIDLSGDDRSTLRLDVNGAEMNGTLIERVELRGTGRPEAHDLRLRLRSSVANADIELEGQIDEPVDADPFWRFRVGAARIEHPDLEPWTLDDAATGTVATDRVSVSAHCWASGDARLCLEAVYAPDAIDVAFSLTDLTFGYFAPIMPADLELDGALRASGNLTQRNDGVLTGDVEVQTTAGELRVLDPTVAVDSVRLEPSHARALLREDETVIDVRADFEHGHLVLNARIVDPGDVPFEQRPLTGELSAVVPDIGFLAQLVPDLAAVTGRVDGEIRLGGTVQDPALTGEIALADGAAEIPVAGIALTDLRVALRGDGGDEIALDAFARSDEGSIQMTGTLSLLGEIPRASLHIQGEEFLMANVRDARIHASPNLVVQAGRERIDVVGEVYIPRARITPQPGPPGAITPSADQVLVPPEDDAIDPDTVREFYARVRIRLGDEVRFEGFGLTGRFEGNVVAVQEPNLPTTATGELRILEGEYRAYGQGLVIETGRIFFAGGPVTEPAVDIRAVRRPREGIEVGAHVVGTLAEPEFTLFSEPPMTQQEQLAYLVLGRPLGEAPGGERSALSQAVLAMGLRGGDFLARNIGEAIGLDQFTIETGTGEAGAAEDPDAAALVAGRYLTPRLYVSYGIGLFNPVNVLRIQYMISERWQVVTQSSREATGADIVFSTERGE
jgi:translocation and assembly module TamB